MSNVIDFTYKRLLRTPLSQMTRLELAYLQMKLAQKAVQDEL